MTSRIRLLPAALADQIAAGEVVERPASVVKELVENALDAGARRVEVEIERGGLGRIVVTDDGGGMSPEEAHLALRRHATSKLRSADELFSLGTFGFRGEALPSIASVAELTLTTRRPEDTAAYAIVVRGGEIVSAEEVGAPSGTRIEARALFANVPARLKFQKAVSTEAGHVVESLVRTALGAHDVHVRLRVDGRSVLELPSHASLAERAHAVLRRTAGRIVKLASATLTEGPVTVEVHLAPPDDGVQSARHVHLLVNRRVVRDRGLLAALQVALSDHLPRGRHPLAVLSVALPPADLDVNVHPQKLEVRLARGAEVYAAVRHAVRRAADVACWDREAPVEHVVIPDARYHVDRAPEPLVARDVARDTPGIFDFAAAPVREEEAAFAYGDERAAAFEIVSTLASGAALYVPPDVDPSTPRFLGAVPGGYLAFTDASGLWLLDQHVASALCIVAAPPDAVPLATPIYVSDALRALRLPSLRIEGQHLVAAPAALTDAVAALVELELALEDLGPEEVGERLVSMLALTPADEPSADVAEALFAMLQGEGTPAVVTQLRFRGRRAAVFVGRGELGRRLDQ
ncbi:MAG: DNA mismatch repair endonuclease MutL [Polyangia bacterium]